MFISSNCFVLKTQLQEGELFKIINMSFIFPLNRHHLKRYSYQRLSKHQTCCEKCGNCANIGTVKLFRIQFQFLQEGKEITCFKPLRTSKCSFSVCHIMIFNLAVSYTCISPFFSICSLFELHSYYFCCTSFHFLFDIVVDFISDYLNSACQENILYTF